MLDGSVTSTARAVMRGPGSISATSRSQARTEAPSSAKARAIARPMPRAAPATTTVLPSKPDIHSQASSSKAVSLRLQITAVETTAAAIR